ncbi:MAG: DNA-directed RNA polymerase subunit omega [Candidatus Sumerlaeaceae bacterium]|nr:DNA-directed RNA polymerase subunit omega [Candidatus Sumerlaeaceae bacterium]
MENTSSPEWFFSADLAELLRKDLMPYLMITVIGKRARQLADGEKALAIPANGSRKAADVAAAEIYEGKLMIRPRRKRTDEQAKEILKI